MSSNQKKARKTLMEVFRMKKVWVAVVMVSLVLFATSAFANNTTLQCNAGVDQLMSLGNNVGDVMTQGKIGTVRCLLDCAETLTGCKDAEKVLEKLQCAVGSVQCMKACSGGGE
jgi:hypothetical protein